MFIRTARLKNFKRFTDLTIDLSALTTQPKLVLLVGANGSGKTSVFDGFEWLNRFNINQHFLGFMAGTEDLYYKKDQSQPIEVTVGFSNDQTLQRRDNALTAPLPGQRVFYGRSSLRQTPQLTRIGQSQQVDVGKDSDRPLMYIERDQRFENDIEMLTVRILEEVFTGEDFDAAKLREQYLNPINAALGRIFGNDPATAITLRTLIPPRNGKVADIRFRKGNSDVHYNLLSSGEKEVVNILFNLFVRRETFGDAVYVIDELDLHLNTALQYALLKEIVEQWIPVGCQLWTASHSLGFIQYAREATHGAIIDFDQFDFDQPRILLPQAKDSLDVYEIAVPKQVALKIFEGKRLVLCEGDDAELYNLLGLADTLFIGVGDKGEVYRTVRGNPRYLGLIDRDYLSDVEVTRLQQQVIGLHVLGNYCIENYLYHPDNIQELVPDASRFDIEAYRQDIARQKREQFGAIMRGLRQARNYTFLRDNSVNDKNAETEIERGLDSDNFESFYRLFDMKGHYQRSMIEKLGLTKGQLAQTNWFQKALRNIIA